MFRGKPIPPFWKSSKKNAAKIIQIIKETEIAENQRINGQSLMNPIIIKNKFQISLQVPSGYLYAHQNNNFLWLKKEITSGNTSILIYQVPMSSIKKAPNQIANIVKMRDSIGSLYIRGTELDTHNDYRGWLCALSFQNQTQRKRNLRNREPWELKNDLMSRAFVNYAILDERHHRILVLEGFCYSPSKEERDLMHELESIIKSIVILK